MAQVIECLPREKKRNVLLFVTPTHTTLTVSQLKHCSDLRLAVTNRRPYTLASKPLFLAEHFSFRVGAEDGERQRKA
jgi:hypothetical protein